MFKHYFEHWFADASVQAQPVAETGFRPLTEAFVHQRQGDLNQEWSRQHEWLQQRTREIIENPGPPSIQTGLFDPLVLEEPSPAERPIWATLADPVERLAAFAADPTRPARARGEAEGVLRIHRQRLTAIEAHLAMGAPEVLPLGVLLLIPEG